MIKIMKRKKILTADFVFYLTLCLVSFVFLSIFSYYTSPFSTCDNGYDAAFFRLVGQGMVNGYLPYRDFFDMKGPFLFFIEYLGQLLSYGRLGIFIIQCINLFFSLFLISKILDRFQMNNRFLQLSLMLPLAYIASFTFEGGNLTEEFSLIPLLLCLLTCLIFFGKSEDPSRRWQFRFFWYAGALFGFCFGLLLMIRVTNAALICAMVVAVVLSLLKKHKTRQLLICAGMFLVGLIVALSPAILFFGMKDLLSEMFEAMFILGGKYSREKSFIQHVVETLQSNRKQQLLLIVIPCFTPFILHWKGRIERFLIFVGSVSTFLAIASGNNYTHYYTLTIPLLLLCEISIVDSIRNKIGKRAIVAAVLTFVMLLSQFSIMKQYLESAYVHLFQQNRFNTEQSVQDISSRIPVEDYQSVFCYNLNPSWYTYAGLFPCIKYCGWQNHYLALMPEIYDDFQIAFSISPPAWLVLPESKGELPLFLEEMLISDYQLVYQNSSYALFHFQGS